MPNLTMDTVELVSTARKAPFNGAPTTEDFNDSEMEKLTDLAAVASFCNDVVRPMFDGKVPDTAAQGLEGATLYTDSADRTDLCWNAQSGTPLTVADTARVLRDELAAQKGDLANVKVLIATLSSQMAATEQNDIAFALQAVTDSLSALTDRINNQDAVLAEIRAHLGM